MSNYWLTPEEVVRKKKRNKILFYVTVLTGTVILSALFTFLAHNL